MDEIARAVEAAGPPDAKIDRLAGELTSLIQAVSKLTNPKPQIGLSITIPGNAPGTHQKILMTDEEFDKALAQIRPMREGLNPGCA
jgi:hypothetical protein